MSERADDRIGTVTREPQNGDGNVLARVEAERKFSRRETARTKRQQRGHRG